MSLGRGSSRYRVQPRYRPDQAVGCPGQATSLWRHTVNKRHGSNRRKQPSRPLVASSPDIERLHRIESLRRRVERSEYVVPGVAVADAILDFYRRM